MAQYKISYRLGVRSSQGMGLSENTGDDFPRPYDKVMPITIFDPDGQPHNILLDRAELKPYKMDTRDGPKGSGQTKLWQDKCNVNGASGTEIAPELWRRADRGSRQRFFIECKRAFAFTSPISPDVIGALGYDKNGYPDDLEFQNDIYVDGRPDTVIASAKEISLPEHAIHFEHKVNEANTVMQVLTSNKANVILTGVQYDYVVRDRSEAPGLVLMASDNHQEDLANLLKWIGWYNDVLVDRTTLAEITTTATEVDGPQDIEGYGFQFNDAQNFGNVATGESTVMFWYQGTIAVTIGGVAQTLINYGDTIDSWQMAYFNISTDSGDLVFTPTGLAKAFDIRITNGQVI